jgi:Uma2 family endonuclease
MEAARALPMSVADYLAFEEMTEGRREYIGGEIHAMSGSTLAHNRISGNIYASLRTALRGGPCQVFMVDVKVRLEVAREDIFYYPDVVVSCHPEEGKSHFTRTPTLVVEVLSPSTETIDRREKHQNYRHAPTLEEYVLVAQDRREVTIFRRASGWQSEVLTAPDAVAEFRSVRQALPLAEIYDGVL